MLKVPSAETRALKFQVLVVLLSAQKWLHACISTSVVLYPPIFERIDKTTVLYLSQVQDWVEALSKCQPTAAPSPNT